MLRWLGAVSLFGVVGLTTQWLLFHPAWLLRKLGRSSPFWPWLDDSRLNNENLVHGYANDYWVFVQLNGAVKETWWLAYKWHLRNKAWNLVDSFKVPSSNPVRGNQNIEVTNYVIDDLHKNNSGQTKLDQGGSYEIFAGLKYVTTNPSDDIWQVNQGDIMSKETSIVGTGLIWYKIGDWRSFRYNQCKIVDYGFWKGWRTIKLGTNSRRYTFSIKHQKIKPWA